MNEKILLEARRLIAGFLKDRRKGLKLTQIQLAEKSGMGLMTIKRAEDGKFFLNTKQLLMLCETLDCYFFISPKDKKTSLNKLMKERWGKISKN